LAFVSGPVLSGFNYLNSGQALAPSPVRATVLGSLLGLIGAWTWLAAERQTLEGQRAEQGALRAELQQAESAVSQASADAQQAQGRRDEITRLQSWQATRAQLLVGLQALTQSPGPQLEQLQFDGHSLSVQGRIASRQLQPWSQVVSSHLTGWGEGELMQLEAPPQASAAEPARFVLRWAVPPAQRAP
jgi:hypothetical protein